MKAGYFVISTSGPHHDRDSMEEFTGVIYDHSSCQVIDRFHYQSVIDMHLVNDTPVAAYRAAELLQAWLSKDCFYFTVNMDKAKHFVRSFLFYQYLNPFEHERSGRQNKLLDIMMLLRASHHMGESLVELPVSPIGEVGYEISRIAEINFPGLPQVEVMAHIAGRSMARGGAAFKWIKSQDEKRKLLLSQRPVVHLGLVDKEVEVHPRVVIPFASSESNKNRFYVYEPSSLIKTPKQAIAAHMAYRERGGERAMTPEMSGEGIYYIDANKSDLLMGLDEVSARYSLDFLPYDPPARRPGNISDILRIAKDISAIEELSGNNETVSFYEVRFKRVDLFRWEEIKQALIMGDGSRAFKVLGDKNNNRIERNRLMSFLQSNKIVADLEGTSCLLY